MDINSMSEKSHKQKRIEYVKSVTRKERLVRTWFLLGRITNSMPGGRRNTFILCGNFFQYMGYDLKLVDEITEAVKSGRECETVYKYSKFLYKIFPFVISYVENPCKLEWDRDLLRSQIASCMKEECAPKENPGMVFRKGFRELEYMIITLEICWDLIHRK